jgi:hypothetical protein
MGAPETDAAIQRVPQWLDEDDGTRRVAEEAVPCDNVALPIQRLLEEWTAENLFQTYPLAE